MSKTIRSAAIILILSLLAGMLLLSACGANNDGGTLPDENKVHTEIQLSQVDMNNLPEIAELMTEADVRGTSSITSEQPNLNNLKLMIPHENARIEPVSGVSLTGYGLIDGKLHIQLRYDDVIKADNHGRVYLKSSDGKTAECESTVDFWAENQSDSYQECVFSVPAEELKEYELWGEFWTVQLS